MIKTCLYKPFIRSLITFLTLAGGGVRAKTVTIDQSYTAGPGESFDINTKVLTVTDDVTYNGLEITSGYALKISSGKKVIVSGNVVCRNGSFFEIGTGCELRVSGTLDMSHITDLSKFKSDAKCVILDSNEGTTNSILIIPYRVTNKATALSISKTYCYQYEYISFRDRTHTVIQDKCISIERYGFAHENAFEYIKEITGIAFDGTFKTVENTQRVFLSDIAADFEINKKQYVLNMNLSELWPQIYLDSIINFDLDFSNVTRFYDFSTNDNNLTVNGNIYLHNNTVKNKATNFIANLGDNAIVFGNIPVRINGKNILLEEITKNLSGMTAKYLADSGYTNIEKLAVIALDDLCDKQGVNELGNIIDASQSRLYPVILSDTTINFDLDLSNVTDLSSFDTGSYDLTVNGNITLPESVSVKSDKFKITTFNGKVYAKRNITVVDNEIKIGDYLVTTGIMVGEEPIEKFSITSLLDIVNNATANQHGNYLTITNDSPILPVIDEEVVIDFDIYVQDKANLTINNKINGNGTIYIEEGGMVDSKGGTLGIPLINRVGGKLVLK